MNISFEFWQNPQTGKYPVADFIDNNQTDDTKAKIMKKLKTYEQYPLIHLSGAGHMEKIEGVPTLVMEVNHLQIRISGGIKSGTFLMQYAYTKSRKAAR